MRADLLGPAGLRDLVDRVRTGRRGSRQGRALNGRQQLARRVDPPPQAPATGCRGISCRRLEVSIGMETWRPFFNVVNGFLYPRVSQWRRRASRTSMTQA